jgi:hypothetical protein
LLAANAGSALIAAVSIQPPSAGTAPLLMREPIWSQARGPSASKGGSFGSRSELYWPQVG